MWKVVSTIGPTGIRIESSGTEAECRKCFADTLETMREGEVRLIDPAGKVLELAARTSS